MDDRLLKKMILETIQETLDEGETVDLGAFRKKKQKEEKKNKFEECSKNVSSAYNLLVKARQELQNSGGSKKDISRLGRIIDLLDGGMDFETSSNEDED